VVMLMALQAGCATVVERTYVEEHAVDTHPVRQPLSNAPIVQVRNTDRGLAVDVESQPRCRDDSARVFERQRVTDRRARSATPFVVNSIGALVLGGVGLYFIASAPGRPHIDDAYSRDELSQEGSYGIGAPFLAGSLAFAAVLIVDGVRLRDLREPLPRRTEQLPGPVVECGAAHVDAGALVVLNIAPSDRIERRADGRGHAEFEINSEIAASVDEASAAKAWILVDGNRVPVDLRRNQAYARSREQVRAETAEKQRAQQARVVEARDARGYLEDALQHDSLQEAESYYLSAKPQLDAKVDEKFREAIGRLKVALAARDRYHARLVPHARAVAVPGTADLRAGPSEGDRTVGSVASDSFYQISAVGKWVALAPADLHRVPTWSDALGWVKASDVIAEERWERMQAASRARAEAEARRQTEIQRLAFAALVAPYRSQMSFRIRNPPNDAATSFILGAFGFGTGSGSYYAAQRRADQGATDENIAALVRQARRQFGGGQEGCLALREVLGIPLAVAEQLFQLVTDSR
jgi:hypothetical protein